MKGLFAILLVCVSCIYKSSDLKPHIHLNTEVSDPLNQRINKYISSAKKHVKSMSMDSSFCILIDYTKHSGLKRAFLIDLKNQTAFDSFMVSHGCGVNPWGADKSKANPTFSNQPESHKSSLGKFKIGKRASSAWGIGVKYFLYGLDSSNNNAYKRTIVMHGWEAISSSETYPRGCPEGWGCPAFSNKDMTALDSILQTKKLPVLLWAIN